MTQEELCAWLGLSRATRIGGVAVRRLFSFCDRDPVKTYGAPVNVLERLLSKEALEWFFKSRETFDAQVEIDNLSKHSVQLVSIKDEDYPTLLREIHSPPLWLYYKGKLPEARLLISIVGSRRATRYGKEAASKLASELVTQQIGIVSGLAYGIDTAAHRAAVEAGGYTIGVVASGLDLIGPAPSRKLVDQMIEAGGCVLSEYPLSIPSEAYHFPVRNRIIAGLSKATLVVESSIKSGTLITARSAMSENRDVLAVPGPITSEVSSGPNMLIRDGATPVTCTQDVLDVLDIESSLTAQHVAAVAPTNKLEAAILEHLGSDPVLVDELSKTSSIPLAELSGQLCLMELKGMVRHAGSNHWSRV